MNNDEFKEKYYAIVERALLFSERGRREGLLALEELIDEEKYLQRDIFEFGMRLVVDGTDASIIRDLLEIIICRETDKDEKTLKEMQEESVLSIQAGENTRILHLKLSCYVDFGFEEALKKYSERKNVKIQP